MPFRFLQTIELIRLHVRLLRPVESIPAVEQRAQDIPIVDRSDRLPFEVLPQWGNGIVVASISDFLDGSYSTIAQ
jgi:hypothetical protein